MTRTILLSGLLAGALTAALSATALAQPVTKTPGIPTTPVQRPDGVGALKDTVRLPDLKITAVAPETPGVLRGRWYRVTVANTGRAAVAEHAASLRARTVGVVPTGAINGELAVLTCATPDAGPGATPPTCPAVFIGPLAAGESTVVRAYIQGASTILSAYRVELGVDVCGDGYGPGGGTAPACNVAEYNETNNTTQLLMGGPPARR